MKQRLDILLIEDDEVDVMTVKRALKDLDVDNHLIHKENGEDALSYLKEARPGIILLDLKMPRMGGIEFLKEVKKDRRTSSIPVVVLTSSDEHQDRHECFAGGAAGYMVKPTDYHSFVDTIKTIREYWTRSQLPPEGK